MNRLDCLQSIITDCLKEELNKTYKISNTDLREGNYISPVVDYDNKTSKRAQRRKAQRDSKTKYKK